MLETSLFESSGSARTRKPATVLLSVALHALIVAVLLLVPLAHPQALPMLSAAVGLPLPVAASKPEPKREIAAPAPDVQPQIARDPGALYTPERIPDDIAQVVDDPAVAIAQLPSSDRGSIGRLLQSFSDPKEAATVLPPPPPPPPPSVPSTLIALIRVHSEVQQANLIHQVAPVYPPIARTVHVQGVVILEATISKDGDVRDIRIITGHPLLNQAAIDAVQQWKYKPTLLNGEPVEVITTVTINFRLQ